MITIIIYRILSLIKKFAVISLIAILITPFLVFTHTNAQDNDTEEFIIRLKSREFIPEPGVEPELMNQQLSTPSEERFHALIQFWDIPSEIDRVSLENSGVKLLDYVSENSWFVSLPSNISLRDATSYQTRWIGSIQSADRLSPDLTSNLVTQRANQADGNIELDIRFFSDVSSTQALDLLASFGARVVGKNPDFHRFTIALDAQSLDPLANEDIVQWITWASPPKATQNDGTRAQTNVNTIQNTPYNLSGNGVNLGIWDGGIVDNHIDLTGRLTVVEGGVSISSHATHVAGTMAGDGSNSLSQGGIALQWRGMSPSANIISYFWDNNLADHNGAINTYGIDLSQNSWAYSIGEGFGNCYLYGNYDADSPDYDDIITGFYGNPISIVFAGGNERDDGDCGLSSTPPYLNYAVVPPPATAKNVIAVGGTNSNDDSMTNFSSWGPLDDGRLKPDVVAPGCESTGEGYIKSTLPGNTYGGTGWCGTSMAAPAVSGIIGLLIEEYRATFGTDPLPATLKAILVQTADDLNDGTSYYNPGPDYASGYGRVNAQSAADLIIASQVREDQIGNTQTDTFTFEVPLSTPQIKISLAWDDPPGAVNANPALVNNLNLVLIEPDGITTHSPWVLNPASPSTDATTGTDNINNVEQVQVNSPVSGTWQVQVTGSSVPSGPQGYSLAGQSLTPVGLGDVGPVQYNSHFIDDDNSGNSSGNSDGVVDPGETIELYVDLINTGADGAISTNASISTDSPYVTFLYNTNSDYGDISAGGTATNLNDFDFVVDSSTPGGHDINFTLGIIASNGGPWSDTFSLSVSGESVVNVGLISDQSELVVTTPILDEMGFAYDVLNDNWDGIQGIFTSDYSTLQNYDVVIWYASGTGAGRLITSQEHDTLELYLQAGGRLLVTGYDTLGSPTDPLMADLVRSSSSGDGPFTLNYTIADGSHPIAQGPFGTFSTGTDMQSIHSDHDQAEADLARNAVTVAELAGGRDKIVATDIEPASISSGRVVYWNGNWNASDWGGMLVAVSQAMKDTKRDETGQIIGPPARITEPRNKPPGTFIVEGQFSKSPPTWSEPVEEQTPRSPQVMSTINFDGTSQPCTFDSTVALRNEYLTLGVLFDGPGPNDGGAILDQCGGFGVTGHSTPNFLAFNSSSSLSDGGTPLDPQVISFILPASSVSILAGSNSGAGQPITMQAYNASSSLVDSDTLTLSPTLQPLSVSAGEIAWVEISTLASVFVLDDLTFDTSGEPSTVLFRNTLSWLSVGVIPSGDPHEPNDLPGDCTEIFFDVPITDATIDPPGDWDYYCFEGSAGQVIAADIDAWNDGSSLDSVLTLFDSDGSTVLTENDDYDGLDSYLEYLLSSDGQYYLRVRSFGHPCCGGPSFSYSLLLTDITQPRTLPFIDDMETGINGWASTAFWHQVQDGVSPYPNSHSPAHSWWYGQDATGDYNNGSANSGDLTSPPIIIPGGAQAALSFWNWYETESMILPQSIYFDIYHDSDGNDNISGGIYSDWANDLNTAGYPVTQFNQLINSTALSGYQVLAIFDPEIAFTSAEISAINDFLTIGGRVIVLGEYANLQGVNTVLNSLTVPHGITINSDSVADPTNNDGSSVWPLIYNFSSEPMVSSVSSTVFYATASLSLSGSATALASGDADSGATLTTGTNNESTDEHGITIMNSLKPQNIIPGAPIVMAYSPVGEGALIVLGDSGLWTNEDPDGDTTISLNEYNNAGLSRVLFGRVVDSPSWDQKWLQISIDGGPFQNLLQVTGGPLKTWHEIGVDLSPYADSTVRLRFHFDTVDSILNSFRGWYIDDVLVEETIIPVGPMVYNDHVIDDDNIGQSFGNSNGIADAGETIELFAALDNLGTDTAMNVVACITEDSPYINGFLFNNCSSYGNIAGGAASLNTDDFDLTIDPGAPIGHVIHFTLDVTATVGGPWTTSFDIAVGGGALAPGPLSFIDRVVDDDNTGQSSGNNDGLPNPGETIELYIELLNGGLGSALGVEACISEDSPYISGFLFNQCSEYGDISGGSTTSNFNDFDFYIDPLTPAGHQINFSIATTALNGGPWLGSFSMLVVSSGPGLRLEPVNQTAPLIGGNFTVNVMIDNAMDLGGFEFDLVYNPAIVHVANVNLGGFLGSTGRTVSEIGPVIDNSTGRTSYGATSSGSGTGPSGTGLLATIVLDPQIVGDSDLILENIQLFDTDSPPGSIIPSNAAGHITISNDFFADVDRDGDVDIVDIQTIASHYGCDSPNSCYLSLYDLDNDLDIDIADIQIDACYWGWPSGTFSTCYSPNVGFVLALEPATVVSVQPEVVAINTPGDVFTNTIDVDGAYNLGAFNIEIQYNPTIVQIDNMTLGSFLTSTGRQVVLEVSDINNTLGRAVYYVATKGTQSGLSGVGTLINLDLTALNPGFTNMDLFEVELVDRNGYEIPPDFIEDGNISVAFPALMITKTTSASSVLAGDPLTYTLTIENLSSSHAATGVTITDQIPDQTSFVSADSGGTLIGNQVQWTGLNINPSTSITRHFVVNVNESFIGTELINDVYNVFSSEGVSDTGSPIRTLVRSSRIVYLPILYNNPP